MMAKIHVTLFLAAAASVTLASSSECQGASCKVEVPQDEVSLVQTKVRAKDPPKQPGGQLGGHGTGHGSGLSEDLEAAKRELRDYAHELESSLDSGDAEYANNTGSRTGSGSGSCPGWAAGGMGDITVGVLYLRSETVNNSIAQILPGNDEPGYFTRFLGRIVRSRAGADAASYDGINDKIIEDATPLLVEGIAGSHMTISAGATAKMKPGCGTKTRCPDKKGMVLMEFQVCGSSPAQKPLFKCCNVWGSKTDSTVGGWVRGIADWAFDTFTETETGKNLIGGTIIDGLTNKLPGQLMAGLEKAKIGQPNIVVWPKKLEANMFVELAAAPQAVAVSPQPDCPPNGPKGKC